MGKSSVLFEVIVGTYEEFVLGYQFSLDSDNNKGELLQTFATHSHRASVRSVACLGRLVVSGGADETINIYDMFKRKECGMLMEHNGTVTSLSFTPDCSHLISASEDGSIKVFRQGSWQLEKVWPNAHKGAAVTCLAVHPSGKMALSVGKDHTLRTWNLVKGRPAYTINLYSRCRQLECVVWSPRGALFAVPMNTRLEISSTEKGGVLLTLDVPTKITACTFLSEEVVCLGEESGAVSGHCVQSGAQLWALEGDQRVRGLAHLHAHLVAVTSNGDVRVYSSLSVSEPPRPVASAQAGCRITSLTLFDYKSVVKVKEEPLDEPHRAPAPCTSESKKRKSTEETVEPQHKLSKKHTKKNKLENSVEEMVDTRQNNQPKTQTFLNNKKSIVVCLPKSQNWIVESSKG